MKAHLKLFPLAPKAIQHPTVGQVLGSLLIAAALFVGTNVLAGNFS